MKTKLNPIPRLFSSLTPPPGFLAGAMIALLALTGVHSPAAGTTLRIASNGSNTEGLPMFTLSWTATSNATYLVQSATNLAPGSTWTTLDAVRPADTVGRYQLQLAVTDSTGLSSAPARFYRLILPSPQIFSVEPAIVPPGAPVDFYVLGQSFPTNAQIKINGVTQVGTVYSDSSTLVQPSFTPDLPGGYQFSLVVSGLVVSVFNVVCADPLANPEMVLQGPPGTPPASPEVDVSFPFQKLSIEYPPQKEDDDFLSGGGGGGGGSLGLVSFWLSKKGYDYYKAQSDLAAAAVARSYVKGGGASVGKASPGRVAGWGKGGGASVGKPILGRTAGWTKGGGASVGKALVRKSGGPPVDYFSGEVTDSAVDLAIPGRGLDFVWSRTYHSLLGRFGAGTNGWTFSYDVRCAQNGSALDVYDGTGRKDTFTLGTNGLYTCPQFFREGTLSNNTFTLAFADTGRWVFNPFDGTASAGKLGQIITRNGDTMTLGYDLNGRLVQIVDDLGRTNTVAYNAAGQVASVTDFTGRSVTYQYYTGAKPDNGSAGDLKSVVSPPVTGTPNGNDFPGGKTNAYAYSKGFPLDRDNHLLLTVTDPKGQTAAVFNYDHTGSSSNYLRCISAREGTNPPTVFNYETRQIHPPQFPGTATLECLVNDPVGNVSEYYFDARGRLMLVRDYTGRATPGLAVSDTANRPSGQVRATDPAYYQASWNWNNDSLCTQETAPGGQQVQCVYQSDFDPSTSARKRADCRVVRELASSAVDLNGDGVPDTTARASYFTYDPRFGSGAGAGARKLVAVKTISWAHDPGQDAAAFARKLVAVKTMSWSHDDESPKESVTFGYGGRNNSAASFARKLVAVKTISWSHDDESPKESVTPNHGGANPAAAFARKLVAVKTMSWSHDDEAPKETVTFENDGLVSRQSAGSYAAQLMAVNALGNGMAIKTKGTGADNNRTGTQGDFHQGSHFRVEINGFVTSTTDPRGNVATGTYDAKGNRIKVKFYWDRTTSAEANYAYDAHGQLTTVTNLPDANGRSRVDTFVYSQGRLTQCVLDAGGLALTSSYEYDARGNLTRSIDPRGSDSLFTCNALDQCVRAQSPKNISARGATDYFYDANDNLVQAATQLRDAADTLVGGRTNRFQYDGEDRLSQIDRAVDTTHALTNRYVYDGNDQCVQLLGGDAVSGADPHQTLAIQYDERGLLFQSVAAPGTGLSATNVYTYDANARCSGHIRESIEIASEAFTYDGFGRLAGATNPMGNQAAFYYDANDNPKVMRLFGELNDVAGSAGNIRLSESRFDYDALDRLVVQHDFHFNPATQAAVGDGEATTRFAYSPVGQGTNITDDLGHVTSYAYDTALRPVSVTDALGNQQSVVYDPADNPLAVLSSEKPALGGAAQVLSVTNVYDALGRCVSSTDSAGNTNRYAYDSLNRCTAMFNPKEYSIQRTFDLLDRPTIAIGDLNGDGFADFVHDITTVYTWSGSSDNLLAVTDSNTNTTSYAYDSLGRRITVTEADGTQEQLVWSPRSNLIYEQDANGTTISNTFDLSDRIIHRDIAAHVASGVAATTTFETFTYDGGDRLTGANNDTATTTFAYDSLDDCVSSTLGGLTTTATYDALGNRLSLSYPGGRSLSYTYDVLNRCASVSDSGLQLASYAYDGPDRVSQVTYGNGTRLQIAYDGFAGTPNAPGDYGFGQVRRTRSSVIASANVIDDRTFGYDPAQNKVTRNLTAPFTLGGAAQAMAFQYDNADRLTGSLVTTNGALARLTIYGLDRMGNRTNVTGAVECSGDYTLNPLIPPGDFQMSRYTVTPCDTRGYDGDGNLVSRSSPVTGPTSYQYDYADRLVQAQMVDFSTGVAVVTTANYAYDALGRRISKSVSAGGLPPVATQYLYDVVEYKDGEDGTMHTRVVEERSSGLVTGTYLIDDQSLLGLRRNGKDYYFHTDDQGNVLALSTAGGAVVERYDYDDYGAVAFLTSDGYPTSATSSAVGNGYLWGGLRLDAETGLHNNDDGNYIEPQTGRAVRGKVKSVRDNGNGRAADDNNPWTGGGGGGGGGGEMKKGTVKFFNEAKGFGMVSGGGKASSGMTLKGQKILQN